MSAIFPPKDIQMTLGECVSEAGLSQLRTAETEKYPHVTFFFNGNRSGALDGETQQEIPSLNVPFNQAPRMKALEG